MKKIFGLLTFLLLMISCGNSTYSKTKKLKALAPPGTKMVGENIYIDIREITNRDYLEYLYWVKRVYGVESQAYKNAIPDDRISIFTNETNQNNKGEYIIDPRTYKFSVLGVSKTQAKIYTQWRMDRIAQSYLNSLGLIALTYEESVDDHFTISRYLEGKYPWTIKQLSELIIPVFSLPTAAEEKLYGSQVKYNYITKDFKSELDLVGRPSYAKGFWSIARIQKFVAKK